MPPPAALSEGAVELLAAPPRVCLPPPQPLLLPLPPPPSPADRSSGSSIGPRSGGKLSFPPPPALALRRLPQPLTPCGRAVHTHQKQSARRSLCQFFEDSSPYILVSEAMHAHQEVQLAEEPSEFGLPSLTCVPESVSRRCPGVANPRRLGSYIAKKYHPLGVIVVAGPTPRLPQRCRPLATARADLTIVLIQVR